MLYDKYKSGKISLREYIGAKLQMIREVKGISQTDAAKQLGISRTTLWRIEQGTTEITIDLLEKICQLYETDSKRILPF